MPLSRYMEHVQSLVPDLIYIAQDFTKQFKKAQFVGLQTVESKRLNFMGEKWDGIRITALIRHDSSPHGVPFEIFMIAQPHFIDEDEYNIIREWQSLFDMLLSDENTVFTLGGRLH